MQLFSDSSLQCDVRVVEAAHSSQLHRQGADDLHMCSFDVLRDDLGDDRTKFPHTLYMVAGTQATRAQENYTAILKLTGLTQERHGKAAKTPQGSDDEMEEDSGDRCRLAGICSSDGSLSDLLGGRLGMCAQLPASYHIGEHDGSGKCEPSCLPTSPQLLARCPLS